MSARHPTHTVEQNMEKVSQQFNNSIENIDQAVIAADTIINELDQMIYSATRQKTIQNYQTFSSQLNDLAQSYKEIQNLLKASKN